MERTIVMLKCGHASNAIRTASGGGDHEPIPCCAICNCVDPDPNPINLEQRKAKCCGTKSIVPSATTLPFFEYRGEGSKAATQSCATCGYHRVAHERTNSTRPIRGLCASFKPRGAWEYDLYYCGCYGWD